VSSLEAISISNDILLLQYIMDGYAWYVSHLCCVYVTDELIGSLHIPQRVPPSKTAPYSPKVQAQYRQAGGQYANWKQSMPLSSLFHNILKLRTGNSNENHMASNSYKPSVSSMSQRPSTISPPTNPSSASAGGYTTCRANTMSSAKRASPFPLSSTSI
jgi:hypothetical protein